MTTEKKAWHTTAEIVKAHKIFRRDLLGVNERWLSFEAAGELADKLERAIYNNRAKFDMKTISEVVGVLRGEEIE